MKSDTYDLLRFYEVQRQPLNDVTVSRAKGLWREYTSVYNTISNVRVRGQRTNKLHDEVLNLKHDVGCHVFPSNSDSQPGLPQRGDRGDAKFGITTFLLMFDYTRCRQIVILTNEGRRRIFLKTSRVPRTKNSCPREIAFNLSDIL